MQLKQSLRKEKPSFSLLDFEKPNTHAPWSYQCLISLNSFDALANKQGYGNLKNHQNWGVVRI